MPARRAVGGPTRQVVVTGVSNPTHLLHVGSYLRHLLAAGPGEVAVSCACSPRIDLSTSAHRDLLPTEPRLRLELGPIPWQAPTDRELIYVAVGAPGLKPWARLRRANGRRRFAVVVTDEGLGSYGGWSTRRAAWTREGVAEPWRTVRTTAVVGGARALTSQRWAMYLRDGQGWRVHEPIAAEFRRHVPARGRAGRDVVLLTQPWVEMGVLSNAAHLAQVEQLADQADRAGGRLVVRPHPAESGERYRDFPVLSRRGPAEIDPDVVRAGAVVGSTSTALLNMAAVHGVPAVRVGVPGQPQLEAELGRDQAELLEHFVGAPVADDCVHHQLRLD